MNLDGYRIDVDAIRRAGFTDKRKMNSTEMPFIKEILDEIEKGDVFYDVGANIGLHTACISQIEEFGMIYCFEPQLLNFSKLEEYLENYEYEFDYSCMNIALFDENKELQFDMVENKIGEGRGHISHEGDVTVKCKRLDSLDIKRPDVMKIDVEGAEYRVLQGMGDIVDSCRAIFIEVHPNRMLKRYGDSTGHLAKFCYDNNLKMEGVHQRGKESFIKLFR